MEEFTSTKVKVEIKTNKDEDKEKEMTYKEALEYIVDNSSKLRFSLMNKDAYHNAIGDAIGRLIKFIIVDGNNGEEVLNANKILNNDIKFTKKDDKLYIDTPVNYDKETNNIHLDIVDGDTTLSDNAKMIFTKVKAVINLLDEIYNSLNKEEDFVNAYYKFYNENEEDAAAPIISVMKVFQSLQKLTLDLFNDYKENCKVMNNKKIESILNSIINK